MAKKFIGLTIDEETLFLLNEQVADRERSKLIEDLIRNYLEGLDPESINSDEIKLIKEIDELEEQRNKLNVQLSTKRTILNRIRAERDKQEEEEEKQRRFLAEKEVDTIVKGGILRDIVEGNYKGEFDEGL